MKIVQSWTCMCIFRLSLSNSTYVGLFIVELGGMKYRPTAPRHDMVSQIIRLGVCFIVATTHFLSNHLMYMWRGANCCMVHSSQNNAFLPLSKSLMAMTSGKVQSPFLHQWYQVWLLCWSVRLKFKFFAETSRNRAESYCCTF